MRKNRFLWYIFISSLSSIIGCALFILSYNAIRQWLLYSIENEKIAILNEFDLIAKIQEKMGFDTIPTIWQMQDHFFILIKFMLFVFVLSQIILWMPRSKWKDNDFKVKFVVRPNITEWYKQTNKKWLIILCVIMVIFYILFSYYLYIGWMVGDDWYSTMCLGQSFFTRIAWWGWCWLTHVSRLGEFVMYLFPYDISRTQHWLITPFFFIAFPFTVKYLIKRTVSFRMTSFKGCIFYISMVCLSLVSLCFITLPSCYIVSVDYIYTPIFIFTYFGYLLGEDKKQESIIEIVFISILAFISGWFLEGLSSVGFLVILSMYAYYAASHKVIGRTKYISSIFYFVGLCNLLLSPGPSVRGALESHVSITGGSIPYNLSSLNVIERMTYFPEWIQAIWGAMHNIIILLLLIVIMMALSRNTNILTKQRRLYGVGLLFVSLLSAFAYLIAGAIPNPSTFIPSGYVMVLSFAVVFAGWLNTDTKYPAAITLLIFIMMVIPLAQYIKKVAPLKHYENERYSEIMKQKAEGKNDIVLEYPFPYEIEQADRPTIELWGESPSEHIAKYFKVNSIKEHMHK